MEKKNFLFVSYDALISDIAWEVIKEGNEAKIWIRDDTSKDVGDGFIPKTDNWEKELDWADIVVFDDVLGMGTWAQDLRGTYHDFLFRNIPHSKMQWHSCRQILRDM